MGRPPTARGREVKRWTAEEVDRRHPRRAVVLSPELHDAEVEPGRERGAQHAPRVSAHAGVQPAAAGGFQAKAGALDAAAA